MLESGRNPQENFTTDTEATEVSWRKDGWVYKRGTGILYFRPPLSNWPRSYSGHNSSFILFAMNETLCLRKFLAALRAFHSNSTRLL